MADDDEDWFGQKLEREALHFAAGDGDLDRVKELLAEGYPINAFDDLSWTPLHHAARKEHLAVVRYLIAAGADVNAHEEERIGDTVLKHVAERCSLELARILLAAGADPTIPGWMQLTALDKSVNRKRLEGQHVHRLLLDAARRHNPRWPRLEEFSGQHKKKATKKRLAASARKASRRSAGQVRRPKLEPRRCWK
jgi:ankyrin repeat protein